MCPTCSKPWYSSGWQGPERLRCECGTALNLAEAQLNRQLLDACKELVEELETHLPDAASPSECGK